MLKKYEKEILKAYLNLPARKLLNHQFELEEDYLAGKVSRFLYGERFTENFIPFTNEEQEAIDKALKGKENDKDGRDLVTAVLITKAVCNILNKYNKQ